MRQILYLHGELFRDHLLHHLIRILDSLSPRGQAQVLVERLIWVVSVVQQGVGLLDIISPDHTVGVVLGSEETLSLKYIIIQLSARHPASLWICPTFPADGKVFRKFLSFDWKYYYRMEVCVEIQI